MTVDDDLIAKYLSGEATPEEAIALNDWLETAVNKTRFDELESTWNKVNPLVKVRSVNKDAAWRKVQPPRPMGVSTSFKIGIAASIMLVLFIGIWLYLPGGENLIVQKTDTVKVVSLPDQSVVTLNRDSEIKYPENFSKDAREVSLQGEAFFSVAKDKTKPFVIRAKFSRITVVGTEFNVNTRDSLVEVSVSEGTVLVVTPSDSIYLHKGAFATFTEHRRATTQQTNPNTWAYASRKLEFKDTPVEEVIRAVEKTYGCEISLSNDAVNYCKFSGAFNDDSVDKVLLLLSETLNLKLEQNGKIFILEGGEGCPQ